MSDAFPRPPSSVHVRVLRNDSKLTQTQFGQILPVSRRCIQDWEGGQRQCPAPSFELLCLVLIATNLVQIESWESWVRPELRALLYDHHKLADLVRQLVILSSESK